MPQAIAVFGAGAIGSLVGARLQESGVNVRLVGRETQVDAIRAKGLLVKGQNESRLVQLPATTTLAGAADIILLTVKSQDVQVACRTIAALQSDATVVTMQNGVRSDQEAADILGRDRVVGCVLNISATYLEPGVVEQNTRGLFQVGAPFPESKGRVDAVLELLSLGIKTEPVPDIARARWTKLMANLNNAIMAITGWPIGKALRHPGLTRLSIATIREGVKTAQLGGYGLDQSRRARTFRLMSTLPMPLSYLIFRGRLAGNFPPDSTYGPSTLQSFQRHSSSELDYLNGEIVTLGERIRRPTPYNSGLLQQGRAVFATGRHPTPEELLSQFRF
ncbi:MAG: 2-dehydropantoate 2-reductase [Chloroflexota bacterium]|jgi:2-dehydropantoate 2-reductase|nr:2-dehydropantoate 2-reductase [Chloroflexota bacterium]